MAPALLLAGAGVGIVGGGVMLVFHRQLAPLLLRFARSNPMTRRSPALEYEWFRLNSSGYVPVLVVISVGWVVVGLIFLLAALGIVE